MANREVRTVSEGDSYRVEARVDAHALIFDEPMADGGTDTGPSPVQAWLAALVGCLTVSFKFHARRKGIAIQRIEGWAVANERRYIESVAVELEVWSPAPEADVRALLSLAERGCFVKATLKPEIQYSLELAVYPTDGAASPRDAALATT